MAGNVRKFARRELTKKNKVGRVLWRVCWSVLFRPTPRFAHGWRRFLLRLFGAKMGARTYVYPSAQIWAPWQLEMGDDSCLSHFVDCYCVDKVKIGQRATVSQYSYLCTASHDYNSPSMALITGPIVIEDDAWITADVFVGPGVVIGVGSVVGARSTVTRNVSAWTVVAGNPVEQIATRVVRDE